MNKKIKHLPFPRLSWVKESFSLLSPKKKIALYGVLLICVAGIVFATVKINQSFMNVVPKEGGTLTEGMVGFPRFVNPVLAISETDRSLSALVYAGLLKHGGNGGYVSELAKSYAISEDGLQYTVKLKPGLTWHDGEPLTAEDVVFTIRKIQNDRLGSPLRPNWEGVQVLQKDKLTVLFTLEDPYGPFLENLTVEILPKHLWKKATDQEFSSSRNPKNIHPVGSGPYKIEDIEYSASGIRESYTLSAFESYSLGEPYIQKIQFRFYPNMEDLLEALHEGEIKSVAGISPETADKLKQEGYRIETTPLLRIFAVFFNQNENTLLTDDAVREALSLVVDKKRIIEEAFLGYGFPIEGPLPIKGALQEGGDDKDSPKTTVQKAREILENAGWTFDEKAGVYVISETDENRKLAFTLTTLDAPDLKEVAQILKENWEALGAKVTLQFLPPNTLVQEAIRPREYEALLFGEVTGHNPDLYAFWHSSEQNDPGLNIGLYAGIKTDELLEEARTLSDEGKRMEQYKKFTAVLDEENPAIFLYSPQFIYLIPRDLEGFELGSIAVASDRFFHITKWFLETENVWSFFLEKKK